MPSLLHEALLEMFRDEPTLIPQLVREVHHVQVPRELSKAARRLLLEAVMQLPKDYQYKFLPLREVYQKGREDGAAEGKAEGEAKGKAEGEAKGKSRRQSHCGDCDLATAGDQSERRSA